MRELFFRLKSFSIITVIVAAVVGTILLIKPAEGVYAISIIIGASLIIFGVAAWISYLVKERLALLGVIGTILIIGGIIICFTYQLIASIVVLMLGVFLVISGIVNLFASFDSHRLLIGTWLVSLIMSVLMTIFGFVVIILAPRGDEVVGVLLGAALLFYALMDILAMIEVKQKAKKVSASFESAKRELENAMNQFDEDVQNSANEFKNDMNFASGNAEEIDAEGKDVE